MTSDSIHRCDQRIRKLVEELRSQDNGSSFIYMNLIAAHKLLILLILEDLALSFHTHAYLPIFAKRSYIADKNNKKTLRYNESKTNNLLMGKYNNSSAWFTV